MIVSVVQVGVVVGLYYVLIALVVSVVDSHTLVYLVIVYVAGDIKHVVLVGTVIVFVVEVFYDVLLWYMELIASCLVVAVFALVVFICVINVFFAGSSCHSSNSFFSC